MGNLIDETGNKHGKLTVVGRAAKGSSKSKQARWECVCECGKKVEAVFGDNLRRGHTTSCGCEHRKVSSALMTDMSYKHGLSRGSEHRSWSAMKARCTNENISNYHCYGGRGIKVCDRWMNSFENFYEDLGPRPKGTSIDRINVNGNYEPGNCRWATAKEQAGNRRK